MSQRRFRLLRATDGRGVLKFAFGACLLAMAVASSAPGFEANPLIDKGIGELRAHLPEALDKITHAMGG